VSKRSSHEIFVDGHEAVYEISDPSCNMHSIVAINDTARGPALGGTRFLPYDSLQDALDDVLLLARNMTYKAAAADLPLGGGKAVIIGEARTLKSDALLESYGRALNEIGGRYVTAEDVGTTVADMEIVRRATPHVSGLSVESGGSGDPSPFTAHGVLAAVRSVAEHLDGRPDLAGLRVAVQGLGKVGGALVGLLHAEGCDIVVSDLDKDLARDVADRFEAERVSPRAILSQACDILAPCALGGAIGERTLTSLRCRAIVGSANNQLTGDDIADCLSEMGVLYVPDFIANAGGLINIADELKPGGYSPDRALESVAEIGRSTMTIICSASVEGTTPLTAARTLAESRLN